MTRTVRAVAYLLGSVAAGVVAVAVGAIIATAVAPVVGVAVGAVVAVAGGVWVAWAVPVLDRAVVRLRCHRSAWCCQYQDGPMCNSPHDPHWTGRWRVRRMNWKENDNDPDV